MLGSRICLTLSAFNLVFLVLTEYRLKDKDSGPHGATLA